MCRQQKTPNPPNLTSTAAPTTLLGDAAKAPAVRVVLCVQLVFIYQTFFFFFSLSRSGPAAAGIRFQDNRHYQSQQITDFYPLGCFYQEVLNRRLLVRRGLTHSLGK